MASTQQEIVIVGAGPAGMMLAYLGLLHELCSAYPPYRLDFGTTVLEAVSATDVWSP